MLKNRKKKSMLKSTRLRRSYEATGIKTKSGTAKYQREYYALTRKR